jgi:hypothetical protein
MGAHHKRRYHMAYCRVVDWHVEDPISLIRLIGKEGPNGRKANNKKSSRERHLATRGMTYL